MEADYGNIPQSVTSFISEKVRNIDIVNKEMSEEFGADFLPSFAPLFYISAMANGTEYFLGYRVGVVGNGAIPVRRLVKVDSRGKVVQDLSDVATGDMGKPVFLTKGVPALALINNGSTDQGGSITIMQLLPAPKKIWDYRSPKDVGWYSDLYLNDFDKDGSIDVFILRTVRDFTAMTSKEEMVLYKYDEVGTSLKEAVDVNSKLLEEYRVAIRSDTQVIRLTQNGPAFNTEQFTETK